MLWQSVVGKLWFTILLLVTVVLTILMVMLLRFFETFNLEEAEARLSNYATMVTSTYEAHREESSPYRYLENMSESLAVDIVIVEEGQKRWSTKRYRAQERQLNVTDAWARKVLEDGETVVTEVHTSTAATDDADIMLAGVPLGEKAPAQSGIFLYQPLAAVEAASQETKQIIYFSAAIALILTTVFAFFLSTRITAPLRKMRQAALEVAQGKFHTKVPILTHDEIGQLAIAFNRMRRELNYNMMALNQEKEQLAHILLSMADGVITLDRRGEILLTNPPAERMLSVLFYEEQTTMNDKQTLPAILMPLFRHVVSAETEQLMEQNVQGRSMALLMAPLYEKETVRGAVAVIRDVTEERRHDKLRKDFIANVSHELRTPISMLQGYSEAMIDGVMETEGERQEAAQIIYDESLRMGRLVHDLLDLARMEADHITLNKETVEINIYLEKVVRKFVSYAKERGVHVFLTGVVSGRKMDIDPDRIEQVLTNLIHNAIRHTRAGGSVEVRYEWDHLRDRISVIDTGTGIPEEDLPYVFERFYKADKARTRDQGGTGLGLAIAKHLVEAHGGEISVQSKVSEGTVFYFTLPRNQAEDDTYV
ncbi:ATP-binding protein [Shouchella lonarensis]|uniref:histidine kinase n=1 Tax=Shouchella lonarensis TaxID=1464122 RepID=A0A1G6LEB8_9BACI|nr:ATP-binding protein [Shouchella lonarensis]SDC41554.1 two-component system, OmpR family, sensor histidine kinase ResE [Shouchella lonarensis]